MIPKLNTKIRTNRNATLRNVAWPEDENRDLERQRDTGPPRAGLGVARSRTAGRSLPSGNQSIPGAGSRFVANHGELLELLAWLQRVLGRRPDRSEGFLSEDSHFRASPLQHGESDRDRLDQRYHGSVHLCSEW